MDRRQFFKAGAQAAVVGAAVSAPLRSSPAAGGPTGESATGAILKSYTAEDHRRRLENTGGGSASVHARFRPACATTW